LFIERKVNPSTHAIELWQCEWENPDGAAAKKVFISKIGDEQPLAPDKQDSLTEAQAICWAYGRTLGNIAVFSPSVLGTFTAKSGNDATLPCEFVNAGKYRHGADRWWCRTHQTHWGTKADLESFARSGQMQCANQSRAMNYVLSPFTLNAKEYHEVGIWCSLPAALSSRSIEERPPRIHVHVRQEAGEKKVVDRDYNAISLVYNENLGLFESTRITRVNITPPAAFEFVCALEYGRAMDCIVCSRCGYPHLDLGDFARKPHRKHFCGNCGWDATWSKEPIVSTPLKLLHDHMARSAESLSPKRSVNLDDYPGCNYNIWASTPAIVWTADRPQEVGIHVHVHDGTRRVVDDTFSDVVFEGRPLDRKELFQKMVGRTTV